ncbi:Membrane transporter [Schizosaccharomyces pombe]
MKFSHSLQFNAVPEWSESYIAYSNLKKLIYSLEHEQITLQQGAPDEETRLLEHERRSPDDRFMFALDKELQGIVEFYAPKEKEIADQYGRIKGEFETYENEYMSQGNNINYPTPERLQKSSASRKSGRMARSQELPRITSSNREIYLNGQTSDGGYAAPAISRAESTAIQPSEPHDVDTSKNGLSKKQHSEAQPEVQGNDDEVEEEDDDDDDEDEDEDEDEDNNNNNRWLLIEQYPSDIVAYENFVSLKRKLTQLYVSIHDLISYVHLNYTGFSKILKKYDKTLGSSLRESYMKRVNQAYPFLPATGKTLSKRLNIVAEWYAKLCCQGDTFVAIRRLRGHLREYVAWERNTIWREMMAMERRTQAARLSGLKPVAADEKESEQPPCFTIKTKFGVFRIPRCFFNSTIATLITIIVIFILLLSFPVIDNREQNNCLALLVMVSLLWATEAIPLFVTSFLVPFMTVFLKILRDENGSPLSGKESTKVIFSSMWNPTIVLLLGGFTIAAALSKYHIAKRLATSILAHAGRKPRSVLLTNMFVAMFASMWISNVAAPVLCFSIIQPLLRNLPAESDFAKILIVGIALASNVGGIASPISSPQNIVALQNMDPAAGWGEWFAVSIPVSLLCIFSIWFLLSFGLLKDEHITLAKIRSTKDTFTGVQWFISIVTIGTIVLWCLERRFDEVFGDMGVIALVPIIVFFGTGLLTKEDFNNFLWTVIVLAMGGVALGKVVSSSGLLELIALKIGNAVSSLNTFRVLLIFSALTLVVSSFISHIVAAMVVLPIVHEVGSRLADPHPRLFVLASGMMCSLAMALPTSGFPNMTAIMMENEAGKRYLKVSDFLKAGIPATLISFVILLLIGTPIMRALGF